MKVLHYMMGIPPVRGGGLIRYATDLMKAEQEKGLQVILLIPGKIPRNTTRKIKIKKYGTYEGVLTYAIENPLPVSMGNGIMDIEKYTKVCDRNVYREFLDNKKPDLLHVHSLMGLHKEFLEEAEQRNIPVIFTTHDYFGICPTLDLMFAGHICEDREWKHCELCCQNAYSDKKLRIEQSGIYRFYRKNRWMIDVLHKGVMKNSFQTMRAPEIPQAIENLEERQYKDYSKLHRYYRDMFSLVTYFHFNSNVTRNIYEGRLEKLQGEVIPVSHSGICDLRKNRDFGKTLKIGYMGNWTSNKGFYVLLEALNQLYQEQITDFELHVYSETEQRTETYVRNHRNFAKEELPKIMEQFDVLIVPSLWPETFGLVVLEAISYGVPVIVSKNVGAKDILEKHPKIGFCYDGTVEELKQLIKRVYDNRTLLEEANQNIMEMDYDISYEAHLEKMLSVYGKIIKG